MPSMIGLIFIPYKYFDVHGTTVELKRMKMMKTKSITKEI